MTLTGIYELIKPYLSQLIAYIKFALANFVSPSASADA